MTNEEALNILEDMNTTWSEDGDEAINVAIKALENAEKYKWHDLRKNPKDLPPTDRKISFVYIEEFYNDCFYRVHWCTDSSSIIGKVRAWKEIEPFKEGETK